MCVAPASLKRHSRFSANRDYLRFQTRLLSICCPIAGSQLVAAVSGSRFRTVLCVLPLRTLPMAMRLFILNAPTSLSCFSSSALCCRIGGHLNSALNIAFLRSWRSCPNCVRVHVRVAFALTAIAFTNAFNVATSFRCVYV